MVYERTSTASAWNTWTPMMNRARYNTRANSRTFRQHGHSDSIPDDAVPISINTTSHRQIGISSIRPIPGGSPMPYTLSPNIPTLAPTDSRLHYFIYNIILNNGGIFSDGSYDRGKASYAILAQPRGKYSSLRDIDYTQLLYKTDMVDGPAMDTNSYRAELGGILAAIQFTNGSCQSMNVTTGTCTLYCDCKGALSAAFGHKRPTPRWSSFDIIRQIRQALAESPIQWKHQHVKGHQDEASSFGKLDIFAQGNIIVDHLASRKILEDDHPRQQTLPCWIPRINDQVICGDLPTRLKYSIFRPQMEKRWRTILDIPLPNCNWDIFFKSLATQPQQHYNNILKFHARLLPVGKNLLRRKHSANGVCPGCGDFEDHEHLITCNNELMTSTYASEIDNIDSWLTDTTSDYIRQSVLTLLHCYRHDTHEAIDNYDPDTLVAKQIAFGQRAFFAGAWHHDWLIRQELYHGEKRVKQSATKWITKLIHKIQLLPVTMWKTRNEIMHSNTKNHTTEAHHSELNTIIDNIFSQKPHSRTMSHCDSAYFTKHSPDKVKQMKLRRKTAWITGANLIIQKYEQISTEQSARFVSFFQWDDGG